MSSGKNIHNAFSVVYETYKSVQKLMSKCQNDIDEKSYYIPADRFLRYNSDTSWEGWIYWSFILLFQRKADGEVMNNKWINAPVYAVEINLDSDTCDEPELIVAKFNFGDISGWSKGCSPSSHGIFYYPMHNDSLYDSFWDGEFEKVYPKKEYEERVRNSNWGLKNLVIWKCPLIDVKQDNYKDKIFGTIERLNLYEL